MQNHFSSDLFHRRPQAAPNGGNWEQFAQVPPLFHQHLSPEQYQAMRQFYRAAYESARAQAGPQAPWSAESDTQFDNPRLGDPSAAGQPTAGDAV
jgi:hypothetical protein